MVQRVRFGDLDAMQRIRVESDERLVADGWGTVVGYDYEAGAPRPLPEAVRDRVEPLLG